VQRDRFYFGGIERSMRVARMAGVLGKTCIPHISSTGLGYLYMMHFVSAIPNSSCLTSTLRSDDDGVIKVPTGPTTPTGTTM